MLTSAESYRAVVDCIFGRYRHHTPVQSALIPFLQDVQSELGYIPAQALERVSQLLKLSTSHIYGVASFYHQFRFTPKGKHLITVCRGTACHVKGSFKVYDFLMNELELTPQIDTSKNGLFTLQQVRCVGACSLAPILKIDENFYGNVNPSKVNRILSKYRREG